MRTASLRCQGEKAVLKVFARESSFAVKNNVRLLQLSSSWLSNKSNLFECEEADLELVSGYRELPGYNGQSMIALPS